MIKYYFCMIHIDRCFHLYSIYEERYSIIYIAKIKDFQAYL